MLFQVSWSPKGKHLAIGLQTGDTLTFALNNKSTLSKHIPPAAEGRLIGLNWLSPGHSFRLTYAPQIENEGDPVHQIVSLDIQSNNLTVFSATHPFTMSDRYQETHALILPHWDEDSASEHKSLVVVGDRASVDLEILGGHNGQWYQQSQENPISLPLDRQTGETTLMVFDVDLTDLRVQTPILYAYLTDGSLQAWYLEHSKPYPLMVSTGMNIQASSVSQDVVMDDKVAANALSEMQQISQPIINESLQSFAMPSDPSSHVSLPSDPTSFGPLSWGAPIDPSASQSGSGIMSSGNAFANVNAQPNNFFNTPNFGMNTTQSASQPALPIDEMMQETSMSDSATSGFRGDGSDAFVPTERISAFGGPIKPAQGYSAFSNLNSGSSANGSQIAPTVSAFGQPSFGQASFGQTGFGKPVIPATQGSGGFAAFASAPSTFSSAASAVPSTGGFAAFATGGAGPFGSVLKQTTARSPFASGEDESSSWGKGSLVFGSANNASNNTSNFELRKNTGESISQNRVRGPPSGIVSPPSSPELSSSDLPLDRKKTGTASNAPAPGFLQQSSAKFSAFGPLQESSPFFRKPDAKVPAVTVFDDLGAAGAPTTTVMSSGFGAPSQLGPAKPQFAGDPAFGMPPKLGVAKSAFAPTTTTPTTLTKAPSSGGFGAFSAATSGFSALTGSKSFSELLKEAKDEESSSKVDQGPSTPNKPKATTNPLETVIITTPPPSTVPREESTTPKGPPPSELSTTPKGPPPSGLSTTPKGPPPGEESTTPKGPPPGERETTFSTASVSSLGSFVDVAAEKSREGFDEEGDDIRSFLSSDFSSGPPTDDEESDEEDETVDKGKASAAPYKESPSPTPQPEVPLVEVSTSSTVEVPNVPPQEESTTPPGSPPKHLRVLSHSSSLTPVSVPPNPTPPSHTIGSNRLDTRPARSSPLAGVPVSGADEEEEVQTQTENASKPSVELDSAPTQSSKQEDDASKSASIVSSAPEPESATEPAKTQAPLVSTPPLEQAAPASSQPAEPLIAPKQEPSSPAASNLGSIPPQAPTPAEVPKTALITSAEPTAQAPVLAGETKPAPIAPVESPTQALKPADVQKTAYIAETPTQAPVLAGEMKPAPITPAEPPTQVPVLAGETKPTPAEPTPAEPPTQAPVLAKETEPTPPTQAPVLVGAPKLTPIIPTGPPISQSPPPLVPKHPVPVQAETSAPSASAKLAAQTGQNQSGTESVGAKPSVETPNQAPLQAPTTKPTTSSSPPLVRLEGLQKECMMIVRSTENELKKVRYIYLSRIYDNITLVTLAE